MLKAFLRNGGSYMSKETLNKWRLILGRFADHNIPLQGEPVLYDIDDTLDYLYGQEYTGDMGIRDRQNQLYNVANWITKVRELFPVQVVEVLEHHALEKYNMEELLMDKEVLERLEPNRELLKSILQMKDLMQEEVLLSAKRIVKKVADEIKKEMEQEIKESIIGKLNKSKAGHLKNKNNIDLPTTIKRNLKHYNKELDKLIIQNVHYHSRIKSYHKWDIIIAVDESGSMLGSVIHSAVMAGIFASLSMLRTRLVIFDTEVVDLSDYIDDPVRTMMSVQLGGGTHIFKALAYCHQLITTPHRTIMVLVTDLYENGSRSAMYHEAQKIIDTGATLIVLTSLDKDCKGVYDQQAAQNLQNMGAHVAALTPEGLAKWVAGIIS